MLLTLSIDHFLTIEHLEMDFEVGLTVLTGESGAGKSIIMDAMLFVLGHKMHGEVVRPGQEQTEVAAMFAVLPGSETHQWLCEQDVTSETEVVMRRIMNRSGRSKAYLNGKLLSLQQAKSVGERLIHVHGQHAHQQLLHVHTARSQLDRYAGHMALLTEVSERFQAYQTLLQCFRALESPDMLRSQLVFQQFQRKELLDLAMQPNEIELLYQEHKKLHHLQAYLFSGTQIESWLSGDENGICRQLSQVEHELKNLPDEDVVVKRMKTLVSEALIQCEEAAMEARAWVETLVDDPERRAGLENRMSELHHHARKYQVEVSALPTLLEQLIERCEELERALEAVPLLEKQLGEAHQVFLKAATKLSESRAACAPVLSAALTGMMRQLGVSQGEIKIQFSPTEKPDKFGLERVEYEVKTNPGMPFQLLSKVLSGGELSRFSLAVELMTNERAAIPTLVFDEVDVGIGGKTAAVVGQLLRQLGKRVQVLCVTHQPQVAAFAHYHWAVKKCLNEESSLTYAVPLSMQERAVELAAMLGGISCGDEAHDHARSLLEESQCG
ncbi:MAG: DNA repair protein RecN [Gammaproteobacteria bacterium]|nr:DNA repair protein RecN [Gammaproteobacteria bacterium]